MNGDIFNRLTQLTRVELQKNICIDESFDDPRRVAAMPGIVTEKCGFPGKFYNFGPQVACGPPFG